MTQRRKRYLTASCAVLLLSLFIRPGSTVAQVPKAQRIQLSETTPVSAERSVVRQLGENARIERVGSGGKVIVSRTGTSGRRFNLYDAVEGTSVDLPFVASRTKSGLADYGIRVERDRVIYTEYSGPLYVYDINAGTMETFTHPRGPVTYASFSSTTRDVVFQVLAGTGGDGATQHVYIQRKGMNTLIHVGRGDIHPWSPDGRLFLMRPADSRGWLLYGPDGEPALDLRRYGEANWVRWAPNGERLVLWSWYRQGLYVVDLTRQNEEIAVNWARYFDPPDGTAFSVPKWSPDSRSVAFHREILGDQTGRKTDLRIFDLTTFQQYVVGSGYRAGIRRWHWGTRTSIVATAPLRNVPKGDSDVQGKNNVYSISIQL